MPANRNHLQCINGHYRYRRRWPKNVRAVAKGEYFIRHLATSSLEEALRLRPAAEIEFFSEVDRLNGLVEAKPRDVSQAEATILVARWFSAQVRQDAENDLHNPVSDPEQRFNALEASRLMAEFVSDQVGSGELEPFEVHASRLFEEHGIKADPSAPGFRATAQLMARADRERWLLREARLRGDFGYQPTDPVFSSALREEQHKKAPPTVGGLIEAFKADRAPRWSPSSVAAYAPVERVLREVLGSARQLDTLGREDGRKLFDTVRQLPKGLGKSPKLRGLSVAEAIKTGLPPISPKSINATYLAGMKATFRFAVQEQWMAADPLAGLTVVDPVAEADKRDPFTLDQLNKIFGASPWTPRDPAPKGRPLHYWGPLIALFLGMRRGEIAQLRVDDVAEVEKIPVLLVRAGFGKRLKTTNARRMLPLHPELLRLGFLNYAEERRASGAELLWEGEEPDSRGQWGDGFSDWFVRLLKARDISGTKLGLHSFRHNFQDRLREAGLHGTALGQELAGRSKGGHTSNNYGSGYPTAMLAEAIAKIRYQDLHLPPA
ncbi:site-specific integrase [Novosphingobium ginsenosidimutans]|uniref:site-specific integrase n=1 Tax=Novosphingobium ginsenosidimutans TaxID=1176536 RepID=UPI0013757015|nr:site-specific integrase [Novosphingobium ginsenosidimutans]